MTANVVKSREEKSTQYKSAANSFFGWITICLKKFDFPSVGGSLTIAIPILINMEIKTVA